MIQELESVLRLQRLVHAERLITETYLDGGCQERRRDVGPFHDVYDIIH